MMIPKKKRITIMVIAIIVTILIIITTGLLLYLNTDMFKSNKTLFMKYLGQNTENLNQIYTRTYTATEDCRIKYTLWGNANSDIFEFQLWAELDDTTDSMAAAICYAHSCKFSKAL